MIEGVESKKLQVVPDERGGRLEVLKREDAIFSGFGQITMHITYPKGIRAWYAHQHQEDQITAVSGMIKLVLYDNRQGSPTQGEINEFFIGTYRPRLVKIPRGVIHGWKCLGESDAMVITIATETYHDEHPDEVRIDPYENDIPYRWGRGEG